MECFLPEQGFSFCFVKQSGKTPNLAQCCHSFKPLWMVTGVVSVCQVSVRMFASLHERLDAVVTLA